jgi:hypothetical protein
LLGCSKIGTSDFPAYAGEKSMYEVHKYMALDAFQVGYFITQVGLSAASFGVETADVEAVGMALQGLFGYKCAAPATVVPSQGPQLQAVCIEVRRRVSLSSFVIADNVRIIAQPLRMGIALRTIKS